MTSSAKTTAPSRCPVPWQRTPVIKPGALIRGRFELISEIGCGGLSSVYKARDMVADGAGLRDPIVALKIIVADDTTDPDMVALMHREARRLRDLVHPNIVRVYDMDVQGDVHFMVMEYLDGRSLARALRETESHRLEAGQVDRLVADISVALAFAHSRNVIHADLKPDNVLVERTGQVKLIDFNIAHPVARAAKMEEEDTIVILGRLGAVTPLYASPQRLAGAEPSEGDDVFSLAVLAFIAIAGERPFGKLTALKAAEEKISPARPAGLSRARWNALRRGLALDDRDRTRSISRFADEFLNAGSLLPAGWMRRKLSW